MMLSEEQSTQLRALLEEKYAATLRDIELRLQQSDRDPGYLQRPRDRADFAVADVISELGHALMDREIEDLRALEAAFGRLREGSIAQCSDCEGGIAFERLRAYPYATRCLPCQQRHDHLFAVPRTPSL